MNGVVLSSSLRIAGDFFDEVIARYVRRKYNMVIGQVTAEAVKINLGQVYPGGEELAMEVKGRDAKTGSPRSLTMTSTEVFGILQKHAAAIADEVTDVLSRTSPELVGDIAETGITLTGGCAQIAGMDKLIEEKTQIPTVVADDPASCAAYGCGKSLAWINRMQEGPINIARKRMMRSEQQ
jgi:rod shape-determining protein MreB